MIQNRFYSFRKIAGKFLKDVIILIWRLCANFMICCSTGVATGDTGMEIPEGVDPSFLEALPEDVRREVIAEQRRLIRLQQRSQGATCSDGSSSLLASEVSPEFLAALPPNLQEEVLAQQRLEQQRQAAAQANPDDPVDAAAFFQNLQPSLRQAVLLFPLFYIYLHQIIAIFMPDLDRHRRITNLCSTSGFSCRGTEFTPRLGS